MYTTGRHHIAWYTHQPARDDPEFCFSVSRSFVGNKTPHESEFGEQPKFYGFRISAISFLDDDDDDDDDSKGVR